MVKIWFYRIKSKAFLRLLFLYKGTLGADKKRFYY